MFVLVVAVIAQMFFSVTTPVVIFIFVVSAGLIVWTIIRIARVMHNIFKLRSWKHFDILKIAIVDSIKRRSLNAGITNAYRAFYDTYNKKTFGLMEFAHRKASAVGLMQSPESLEEKVVATCGFIKDYAVKLFVYRVVALAVFCAMFSFVLKPLIIMNVVRF
jgi:hypothetical protein